MTQPVKDTSVSWIGQIPSEWSYKRLKFAVTLINEKIDAVSEELPYVGLEHVTSWTGQYLPSDETASGGAASKFYAGDVLFGKLRPYLAKSFVALDCGVASTELLVMRPNNEIDAKFLNYYLLSEGFVNIVDSSTYGAKMPRANWEFIGNLPMLIPSTQEQQKIVEFLEHKTSQIDALIEKKRTLIEKLSEKRTAVITQAVTKGFDPGVPMKDSGIEWLGEVPEHWETWKVTHGFNSVGSGTTPKSDNAAYYEGETPWITTSELRENIISDTAQHITKEALQDYTALKIYPPGSLAFAMYGATIGRLGILGVEATVNQACCVFANPTVFDTKFFYYWLQMRRPILISLSVGGGQPNLSQDDLKQIRVPIPNLQEQAEIVGWLDQQTLQIAKTIEKNNELINQLFEYRTSLITAAVTGQMDVRDLTLGQ